MTLLIIGLALWIISHTFKRAAPGPREMLGDRGKGLMALLALVGIVLMVIGYRGAEVVPVYAPVPGMGHLNNLLMLFSVFFMGAGSMKGVVASKIRHNMLTGVLLWALAHLLVNGDLASIVLFGGMALYSVASMWLISRAEAWDRPAPGPIKKDLMLAAGSLVLYGVIAGLHIWLGYSPFLGTYG